MESYRVLEVMDRRRSRRYDLEAQVSFSWKDAEGIHHREEGVSRDISEIGVFVVTNSHPPIGTTVRLDVSLHSAAAPSVQVQAQGQVVRVETADQSQARCGFAVATNVMKVFDRKPDGVGEES